MADLSPAEFSKKLGAAPISLLEPTESELKSAQTMAETARLARGVPTEPTAEDIEPLVKLGARPGVPFDMESGIPFMQRLRAEFQPTEGMEENALKKAYGQANVRRNAFGWLIVTTTGQDGKPKDILVDPVGPDTGDLTEALTALPEIVGGGLAMRGAKFAPGIGRAAVNLLRMTAGASGGRAAHEVLVRAAEGEPTTAADFASRQGASAVLDLATGATLGAGSKLAGTLFSPFSNPGKLQFDAQAAQRYFYDKYGVRLGMTPAEMTGSGFLQRVEALESQKPGASIPFERLMKAREESIEDLRKLALRGNVPDEEEAARRALGAVGAEVAPLENAVERAAFETAQAAEGELLAGAGSKIDIGTLGESLRTRAMQLRTDFQTQADSLYQKVFSNPLTQAKNISGDELAKDATDLLAKLPSIENQVATATGVLNAQGQPVTLTLTKKEPLKEFVPPNVLGKLVQLREGRGQQFRLDELMAMRREVDNDIATGEAIPGVQTRYLSQIRELLTNRIKTGLSSLDNQLLADWEAANSFYAQNAGRFQKAGISNLYKDPEQTGYLGDTKIVSRALGEEGRDMYRAYKEFFGAGSPEVSGIQQAARDEVLGLSQLSTTLDAKGFVNRLESLDKNAPELLSDAFGANAAKLRSAAKALQAARGENLPVNELQEAISSGTLSADKLTEMLSAQAKRDQEYRNRLVKSVAQGNLKGDKIKPSEFVNSFVFKAEPEDLKGAMALLGGRPDVVEDIRRLTFQRVLDNATTTARGTGRRILSADDLEQVLANENMTKRLKTALGADTFEDLTELKNFLKPGATIQQAAKSAGGLSAGQQVAGLVETGALKYVSSAVRNFFIATAYTHPAIRNYVANTALDQQGKAVLVNLAIASTPFIEAAVRTLGEAGARKAILELKEGVDASVMANPSEGAVPRDLSEQDFRRRIGLP